MKKHQEILSVVEKLLDNIHKLKFKSDNPDLINDKLISDMNREEEYFKESPGIYFNKTYVPATKNH